MRKGLLLSVGSWLTGAGLALAQAPAPTQTPKTLPPTTTPAAKQVEVVPAPSQPLDVSTSPSCPGGLDGAGMAGAGAAGDAGGPQVWFGGEYLLWRFKDAPLPSYPFVLTGPNNSNNPGALNAGGGPFLTGPSIENGWVSGGRVTAGGWLNTDGTLGIEGSGFLLPKQSRTLRAASDANGNPAIGFRYFDPPVNGALTEDIFQASIPVGNPFGLGAVAGRLAVVSSTQLWGAEANGLLGLANSDNLQLQALVGLRYADLQEDLSLQLQSTALAGSSVLFLGNPFGPGSTIATSDTFKTRNQFYGGQVGLRGSWTLGAFFASASGKIALGNNHEVVDIRGASILVPNAGNVMVVQAGQFAGPSNIGRQAANEFAYIPEGEVKVGVQLADWLRVSVGYDILYWSQVVRPGSQVDLVVDDRLNPVNGGFVAGTPNVTFPRSQFNKTDFWAQGINFGLQLSY